MIDGLAWIALDENKQADASGLRMSRTGFARAKNNARRRDVRKVAENHWAELERIASIELRRRERQWFAGNGAKRETTVEELYLTAGQCMCLALSGRGTSCPRNERRAASTKTPRPSDVSPALACLPAKVPLWGGPRSSCRRHGCLTAGSSPGFTRAHRQ